MLESDLLLCMKTNCTIVSSVQVVYDAADVQ